MIWSDQGKNFMGAARELKDLYTCTCTYLENAQIEHVIDKFCANQGIQWSFAPEYVAQFGGLYEAAVNNLKHHFRCIIGNVSLTFEVLATILAQVEACLNSRL